VRAALNPARTVLDNGAVLLCKPTHTTPAVAISLTLRAGSIADPPDLAGLTWLLSRVIDRGTATRSAADISEELDSRGITLTILVTRHAFSLGMSAASPRISSRSSRSWATSSCPPRCRKRRSQFAKVR
jgi:predicted Zn-dependent peptidase